jgi:hypothetical protein
MLCSFLVSGQRTLSDLEVIGKNISNTRSPYRYERLLFKYQSYPASVDSIEAQHLYYGRNFIRDKVSTTDAEFLKLAEAFRLNNISDCIRIGKELYAKDPTNLDVLLIILRAYEQKEDAKEFSLHVAQLRLLTGAIKSSGDGRTPETAYLANSLGDEYIFLNILNVGPDYIRSSTTLKDGVMDVWTKDSSKIYVKVFFADLD